ncbi:EexN family lipoprotein [Burkholderia ambifaria]|uniref:EexN family lipoprotein n=1 Tax=Burkholderia ambifaria TaxID=152480 RepID=UPI003397FA60
MKKMCFVVVLILSACGKQHQTVSWYIEHDAEREARIRECDNDSAQYLSKGSDCINAKDAFSKITLYGKEAALKSLNESK